MGLAILPSFFQKIIKKVFHQRDEKKCMYEVEDKKILTNDSNTAKQIMKPAHNYNSPLQLQIY